MSGNAHVTSNHAGASVTQQGLKNWTEDGSVIHTYVYFSQPQTIRLNVRGDAEEASTIFVGLADRKRRVNVSRGAFDKRAGRFPVKSPGYYAISLEGVKRQGTHYPDISSFVIQSADTAMAWVHDFSDYWGRRGPSVHLIFPMPDETVEWFYNEVTVPEGKDITGSYYMANRFGTSFNRVAGGNPPTIDFDALGKL